MPVTKSKEAGLQPASFSFNDFSASSCSLLAGTFTAVFISGLSALFLSGHGNKEVQRSVFILSPVVGQGIAGAALYFYRRRGRRQFTAFVEGKMKEIDLKISQLPKRKTVESVKELHKLESKREYWVELLDFNARAFIRID